MTIKQEYLLEALLRHNYLPRQYQEGPLPPVFHSRNFSVPVMRELVKLDDRQLYGEMNYRETRFNQAIRKHSIPHPAFYSRLVENIVNHWEHLAPFCESLNSLLKPDTSSDGRIMIMDYGFAYERSIDAIDNRFGMNFIAQADISNCFPTIQSDAIALAITGQQGWYSRSPDRLDHWVVSFLDHLNISRAEDTGLPVGPATSNILAEIVLSQIDNQLRADFQFERRIDDYTCYCRTRNDAEQFLVRLRQALTGFDLEINNKKTGIIELPAPIAPEWVSSLQLLQPKDGDLISLQYYLDYALALSKKYPDASVLKYAVKSTLQGIKEESKAPILTYILNLSRHHPLLLSCVQTLVFDKDVRDRMDLTPYLNLVLEENAERNRSDGMCWALFYLNSLSLPVRIDVAEKIIRSQDYMAILLLYHSQGHRYQVLSFLDNNSYAAMPHKLDKLWLLRYELFRHGDYVGPAPDPCFVVLDKHDVTFVERAWQ